MREIKFRGKLKEKYFNSYTDKGDVGDWVYSETISFNGDKVYIGLPHIVYDKSYSVWEQIGETLAFHEIIPETLGQYTGFKDKNGNEIYEEDSDGTYVVKFGTFIVYYWNKLVAVDEVEGWYLEPLPKTKKIMPYEIPLNQMFLEKGVWIDGMKYESLPFDKNIYENPELLTVR